MAGSKIDIWNMGLDRIGENEDIESEDDNRPAANIARRHWDNVLRKAINERDWRWAMREATAVEISEQNQSYTADGVQSQFAIPYAFENSTQIVVTLTPSGGSETEQTAGTHYTVTAATVGNQASITMLSVPGSGDVVKITVNASKTGFDYMYSLPADYVRAIGLLMIDLPYIDLDVEGRARFAIGINDAKDAFVLSTDFQAKDIAAIQYVALVDYVPAMPPHFVDALAWHMAAEFARGLRKDFQLADDCMAYYDDAIDTAYAQNENVGNDGLMPPVPSLAARERFDAD